MFLIMITWIYYTLINKVMVIMSNIKERLLNGIEKLMDVSLAMIPRQLSQTAPIEKAKIIAHRGGHHHKVGLIENTMAAFDAAYQCGCWGIELDVHATQDGVMVVHHDHDLSRLWQHTDNIDALTFDALRKLAPDIPTLSEVVEKYGQKMHFFIEIKAPFHAHKALLGQLSALKPIQDYHLITLSPEVFYPIATFDKRAMMLVAGHNNVSAMVVESIAQNYAGVLGHYILMTRKYHQMLDAAKQKSGVGFVGSQNALVRCLNQGQTWIFTNTAVKTTNILMKLKQK